MIARTPKPPYFAVIFSSLLEDDAAGYGEMSDKMVSLAKTQPGYLGHESVRDNLGITISYWESEDAIMNWRKNAEHQIAQKYGVEKWYSSFCTRVCRIERDHFWERK
jgi:heme-degrading monooxygenase HmoA